jgi:iron complex transport system substrate-binding protein
VATALDLAPEGEELASGLADRLEALARTVSVPRPRVVCVEWLDPIYLAGHWVPELVAAAGGIDIGASPGAHSVSMTREAYQRLTPDLVIVMLCGFGVERAQRELAAAPLPGLGVPEMVIDGNAYTSRPGPRIVDGAETIREALRAI